MKFPTGQARDPRDDAPHLSVSQARMVHRCPLQWRFKYVEQVAPAARLAGDNLTLGIALDRACEAWFRGLAAVAGRFAAGVPDHLQARAAKAWGQFVASGWAGLTPAADGVQRRHEQEVCGWPVIGYSDLITADGVVVDFKYGGRPGDADWVRDVTRQLAFYRLSDPTLPDLGPALILRLGPGELQAIPVDVDAAALEDVRVWLEDAVGLGPDASRHAPAPDAHCGWCDWRTACHTRYEELTWADAL